MSEREYRVGRCKSVLAKMTEHGYVVCDASCVDEWDDEAIRYFLANYASHYLGEEV